MDPDQIIHLYQKPADLDQQCFQKRINLCSAGQGLNFSFWFHPWRIDRIRLCQYHDIDIVLKRMEGV